MGALMDEWKRIAYYVREISEKPNLQSPETLDRLQGDMYARMGARLAAVANWLKALNAKVDELQAEAETRFELDNAFDEGEETVTAEELEGDLFTLDSVGNVNVKPAQRKPKRRSKKS